MADDVKLLPAPPEVLTEMLIAEYADLSAFRDGLDKSWSKYCTMCDTEDQDKMTWGSWMMRNEVRRWIARVKDNLVTQFMNTGTEFIEIEALKEWLDNELRGIEVGLYRHMWQLPHYVRPL